MKVEGLVAVFTGGASGLGRATVEAFSKKNCKVVIADLNQALGDELVKQIGDDKAIFVKTDVSNEEDAKNLINAAVNKFGSIHIVVNCAGILSAAPIITSKGVASTDELMKVLKVNVVGTFNMSKWAAARMATQTPLEGGERGVIINVTSVAGIEGQRGQVVYSASKGAIIGMTLPMARDLGRYGIRVVAIAPGIFHTPMGKEVHENIVKALAKSTPLGRLGDPAEFAHFTIAIAENSYLTGSTLRLDGGIRLPYL
jgi:NAD(P)-dependent dehydrogenase (short-subunit alcohol dehydrogenase family)